MNILFGIQTTGNGHISRAQEILPKLNEIGKVTLLFSGETKQVDLSAHQSIIFKGLTYAFGANGKISYTKTAKNLHFSRFIRDVKSLDLSRYDLILNDFEPISAWAAKNQGRACFSLSHQSSFLSANTPRPEQRNEFVEWLLKYFAPSSQGLGFHFERYDSFILPPVIKSSVKRLEIQQKNHFTVYLPAYDNNFLIHKLGKHKEAEWQIFSPTATSKERIGNVRIQPTSKEAFVQSLASCRGVLTAGGFELCAESMYLGKKLFSIPVANQYEQLCNAAALKKLGVHTALNMGGQFDVKLKRWIEDAEPVYLRESADVDQIIDQILRFYKGEDLKKIA